MRLRKIIGYRGTRSSGHARTFQLLLPLALALLALTASPAPAGAAFGVSAFSVDARNANGTIDEFAASHPFSLDVHLEVNTDSTGEPEGVLHRIELDLPRGLFGNPLRIPRCPRVDFEAVEALCDGSSQIGVLRGVIREIGQIQIPLYNLAGTSESSAAFGGVVQGKRFTQRLTFVGDGADSSIRMVSVLPIEPAIIDVEEEIWGVPADPAHDPERFCLTAGGVLIEGCSAETEERALLTLPASCGEPMLTTLTATSLGPPVESVMANDVSRDAAGNPQPLAGCDAVPFDPRVTLQANGGPLAPTGLDVRLELPQHEAVGVIPSAPLAGLEIALPAGLALNPSAGSWLEGCSAAPCPASSRVGAVRMVSPVADHALTGGVYIATQTTKASDGRYAIYLAIDDEATGTFLKVPGRLEVDQVDGRLTAVFSELPWIPFSELELEFEGGPRALLAGPPSCGGYVARATLHPSTAPFEVPALRTAGFTLKAGAGGSPCPPPEAERKAAPSFHAGVTAALAGRASPLVIALSREDLDQHFGSFGFTLPPGLIADLGSTPVGAAVGGIEVKAGLGPEPLSLSGTAYLGGPYRGAPYSLSFVVPAKAGPIDLGTIVQRAAVDVDPVTAQVSVRSDPLPQILGGVPLEVRSLRIDLDRPGFIRNPTSCEPTAIAGTATTSLGQTAPISDRFQVGGCAALPFKPRLSLALSGAVGRGGHPAVRAVYRGDPSGAAASGIAFRLPAGELLDLRHLGRLCPRDVDVARCPRDSRLGSLQIDTPMLDAPLEGSIYLRVPSGRLPGLTAEVRSGGLHFLLRGRVTGRGGRLGVSLESLPDVPLSRAVLRLPGGRRGLVVNSESLCRGKRHAIASFSAHSGKQRSFRLRPQVVGCSRKR